MRRNLRAVLLLGMAVIGAWIALGDVAHALGLAVALPSASDAWAGFSLAAGGIVAGVPGARTMREVIGAATPPGWSPNDQENLWYTWYDTQLIVSGAVIDLDFFQQVVNDKSMSNMKAAGQFPFPYSLMVYNINVDLVRVVNTPPIDEAAQVSSSATVAGALDDVARIMEGGLTRWQLTIDDKEYGPHRLSTLRGTGGARGWGWAGGAVAVESLQRGFVDSGPGGFNYFGEVIIPTQIPFRFKVNSSQQTVGPLTLNSPWLMTITLQGIAARGAR